MDATIHSDNPRERIGGNNPPEEAKSALDRAKDGFAIVSKAITDLPVIQTEDESNQIKAQIDLIKSYTDELEQERDSKVRPLNTTVASINADYKAAREPLVRLSTIAKDRLTTFIVEEEKRRLAATEEARQAAIAAEKAAREAEAKEREAVENAEAGECVDVGAVVAEADDAFRDYGFAARTAMRAERETHVKVGAAPGARALSLRTKEELTVDDAKKLIAALLKVGPLSEKVQDALLSAARDYRKVKGKLPDGVLAKQVRAL